MRDGNTLSPVIRQVWMGRTSRTLTKTSAARGHGAPLSLTGHITADELRRYFDNDRDRPTASAIAFSGCCAKRARSPLPEAGKIVALDAFTVPLAPRRARARPAPSRPSSG